MKMISKSHPLRSLMNVILGLGLVFAVTNCSGSLNLATIQPQPPSEIPDAQRSQIAADMVLEAGDDTGNRQEAVSGDIKTIAVVGIDYFTYNPELQAKLTGIIGPLSTDAVNYVEEPFTKAGFKVVSTDQLKSHAKWEQMSGWLKKAMLGNSPADDMVLGEVRESLGVDGIVVIRNQWDLVSAGDEMEKYGVPGRMYDLKMKTTVQVFMHSRIVFEAFKEMWGFEATWETPDDEIGFTEKTLAFVRGTPQQLNYELTYQAPIFIDTVPEAEAQAAMEDNPEFVNTALQYVDQTTKAFNKEYYSFVLDVLARATYTGLNKQ